jgi:hypothetical protein
VAVSQKPATTASKARLLLFKIVTLSRQQKSQGADVQKKLFNQHLEFDALTRLIPLQQQVLFLVFLSVWPLFSGKPTYPTRPVNLTPVAAETRPC